MKIWVQYDTLLCRICVVLVCCLVSCERKPAAIDALEERDPAMEEALSYSKAQNYDEAIKMYQQVLMEQPGMAKAHLQLGLLLDDKKQDYIRAIYHYQRYLELRPGAQKRELIGELIRHARLSFATSLPDRPSEAIEEISRLNQQISVLETDLATARSRIMDLSEALRRYKARVAIHNQASTSRQGEFDHSQNTSTEQIQSSHGEMYRVQKGDTLSKIAQRVYNDSSKWTVLYEANKDALANPRDLKRGQSLHIPR